MDDHGARYINASPLVMAPISTATRQRATPITQQSDRYRRPCTPASLNLSENQKTSLDFTQRIERKLAEYNASDNIFKRWLFEVSSWLVSACSMIAIVLIYVRIKDQPMSSSGAFLTWTNVLGKIASAALIVPTTEALGQLKWNWFHNSKAMWDFEIFDKASRGPLGALMLLYRTKGRSLAALGALLILLLLAIDTFFQQVVEISDRWTLQATLAAAPKAYTYETGWPKEYLDGIENASDDKDTFLVIEKFSYGDGIRPVLFGNAVRPDISIFCPTSNCTWPSYKTLGVCSQCADISADLSFACLSHTVDWTADSQGLFDLEKPYPNATACGYFLNATSDNPTLMSGYLWDTGNLTAGEALVMRTLPLTRVTSKEPLYGNGSVHFKNIRHKIQDVFIVSTSDGTAGSVYRNETPVAQECHLSWCIKTMRSSYTSGGYSEEVLDTVFNTTAGPFPWQSFPANDETGEYFDIFYMDDITLEVEDITDGSKPAKFGVSNTTALSIMQGFTDIFPAYTTQANESAPPILRYKTWRTGPPWHLTLFFNPWVAPNNVTRHMERLATALTNIIRSAPSHQDVDGHAFSKETFVLVRWEWLTFPLVLLVLSFVFLVSTIVKTSKDTGAGIWKTSAMPTLIYSLPKEMQAQFTEPKTWDSSQETKKFRIRLLPKTGWRVSGQSQLSSSPQLPHPTVQAPRGWI
ncbi:hypothetical protein CC77DRAFT_989290 [Alternaria alternata]|uniref:DUF3176 domain-containing protein n=1 Tax=Alternaria alternata TaxID=5599 RepID=A0A177DN71_ALTAL|nr:hypothetical protein CC77DRAFT_989290 [Alternaria alternata]OAG20926.1 hypothetical protein CC77DRAFT_989290 [Alternaria alternata]